MHNSSNSGGATVAAGSVDTAMIAITSFIDRLQLADDKHFCAEKETGPSATASGSRTRYVCIGM
jgi:hypothetical protein